MIPYPPARNGAVISPCGRYRHILHRVTNRDLFDVGAADHITWVMLNPSTADADSDDPTMRRVIDFTRRLGGDSLTVVNLFDWRAADPAELLTAPSLRSDAWAQYTFPAIGAASRVMLAWGAVHRSLRSHAAAFVERLSEDPDRHRFLCLGRTAEGHPRHPLYLPADSKPLPWFDLSPAADTSTTMRSS